MFLILPDVSTIPRPLLQLTPVEEEEQVHIGAKEILLNTVLPLVVLSQLSRVTQGQPVLLLLLVASQLLLMLHRHVLSVVPENAETADIIGVLTDNGAKPVRVRLLYLLKPQFQVCATPVILLPANVRSIQMDLAGYLLLNVDPPV